MPDEDDMLMRTRQDFGGVALSEWEEITVSDDMRSSTEDEAMLMMTVSEEDPGGVRYGG
ncbi:hypothetical protein ACLB1E_25460 [Escherichia coli]